MAHPWKVPDGKITSLSKLVRPVYFVPIILDPRYKMYMAELMVTCQGEFAAAKAFIQEAVAKQQQLRQEDEASVVQATQLEDDDIQEALRIIKAQRLAPPSLKLMSSKSTFPAWTSIAKDYLSVDIERQFSAARLNSPFNRSSWKPKPLPEPNLLKKLVVMHSLSLAILLNLSNDRVSLKVSL